MLGVAPWLDGDALEGRLKRACASPRLLHLATHGFFLAIESPTRPAADEIEDIAFASRRSSRFAGPLPENPLLRCGLALAGANTWLQGGLMTDDAEDGILTAEDVTALNLVDTQLVVLSACETGLGEATAGEGVHGLCRAFVLAGAKTLIISLWKVPDAQTCELMEEFYRSLMAGKGRAEALQLAKLAMKRKYEHAYHWGAFICHGDPGPLPTPPSPVALSPDAKKPTS